jgi:trk system potassium uptake protein TrkA
MAMVEQCEAEVMEIILHAGSRVLGTPLKDLNIPRGSIVGAIVRGKEVIIPGGADTLLAEDRAILFTLPEAIPEVERFFN